MPKLTLAALAATVETLTAELARAHARIDVLRKTAEQHHTFLTAIAQEATKRTPAKPARSGRTAEELAEWRAAMAELREEADQPTGWFPPNVVRERIAARATMRENIAAAA